MPNPSLPPEILDYTVDSLHDEPEALKACCLVAKPWVPRARTHLFADIDFRYAVSLELWKKTFPDPSNSPAYHTRSLFIGCPEVVTTGDAEEGGWIRTFSRVVELVVFGDPFDTSAGLTVSLVPFYGFTPVLRSLYLAFSPPNSQTFDLICSLPLLENLTLISTASGDDDALAVHPSTSPPLTGTLDLPHFGEIGPITRQLLGLPNGLHFRKLALSLDYKGDLLWAIALVVGCSDTLECLDVGCSLPGDSYPGPIDLSKATKLEKVVFRPRSASTKCIATTLQTITPKHRDFRQISIHIPDELTPHDAGANIGRTIGEPFYGQWLDLDRLLVHFWESCSVRTEIVYTAPGKKTTEMGECIGCLLPGMMKRGAVDLVESKEL